MSDFKKYKTLLASVEKFSNFKISLQSLYSTENDYTLFSLTPAFEAILKEFYSYYTENETENEQLEAIEKFVDSVNGLMKLGLIRKDQRWMNDIKFQPNSYDIDPSNDNPLTINRRFFFYRRRFGKGNDFQVK
jgi:protein tyrosine phosphatase